MISKLSMGVQVSVETYYQPDYSNPVNNEYMFAYRIMIENHNNFTLQVLRREWKIFDSNGEYRDVEGEGVVGQQPVIESGKSFQYVSGCNLKTEMGKMYGKYAVQNNDTKEIFFVNIPSFDMIVPFKMN